MFAGAAGGDGARRGASVGRSRSQLSAGLAEGPKVSNVRGRGGGISSFLKPQFGEIFEDALTFCLVRSLDFLPQGARVVKVSWAI